MRYLYRVVDRNGMDSWAYPHMDEGFTIREAYGTLPDAMCVKSEAERRTLLERDGRGPFRILRVPVTAWEEVK